MRLPIAISETSREPVYHQIEQQIIAFIVGGQLAAGAMLPSIRALAADLSCSVITTKRAYYNLEQGGYITTVQGKGTFVADVETPDKQKIARDALRQAFRSAIEISLRLQNSEEETRRAFEHVLTEMMNRGEQEQ